MFDGGQAAVLAIEMGREVQDESEYSASTALHTPSKWGDTVSTCGGDHCLPPDGIAPGLADIMAAIRLYQGVRVASVTWLDIDPLGGSQKPDQFVAIGDIFGCIGGFMGESDPGDGPLNCP